MFKLFLSCKDKENRELSRKDELRSSELKCHRFNAFRIFSKLPKITKNGQLKLLLEEKYCHFFVFKLFLSCKDKDNRELSRKDELRSSELKCHRFNAFRRFSKLPKITKNGQFENKQLFKIHSITLVILVRSQPLKIFLKNGSPYWLEKSICSIQ